MPLHPRCCPLHHPLPPPPGLQCRHICLDCSHNVRIQRDDLRPATPSLKHSSRLLLNLMLIQPACNMVPISSAHEKLPGTGALPAVGNTGSSGSPPPSLPPAMRTRTDGSSLRLGSVSGASRPNCHIDCSACSWHLDRQWGHRQCHLTLCAQRQAKGGCRSSTTGRSYAGASLGVYTERFTSLSTHSFPGRCGLVW